MHTRALIKWGIGIFILVMLASFGLHFLHASANISSDPGEYWGWNDVVGWIDFFNSTTTTSRVTVTSQKLTGYASSSAGIIAFDCATTPAGNICPAPPDDWRVVNDGNGYLSGWAWNDTYGWISFWCGNIAGGCNSTDYQVRIDSSGVFSGWAWNDALGWISFNCKDPWPGPPSGICASSDYKVVTNWVATSTAGILDSSTFDTGVAGGAQINSVLWNGTLPDPASDAYVGFQFAAANATSGPWNYVGGDGTSNSWYIGLPGSSTAIGYTLHNNQRYFRYRVKLNSNLAQTASPRIDQIFVNWSR